MPSAMMPSTPHSRMVGNPTNTADTTRLNCLAKALYDNVAESPDELAFRKGDVLTVLEQNTAGLEGWWLCSLRGRQGIAPGNRLRLVPGMYDPTGLGYAGTYPGPGQRHAKRRSWTTNQNRVVTPHKIGDVYLYDVPPGAKPSEEYDVPQSHTLPHRNQNLLITSQTASYDTPPSPKAVRSQTAYDEPRCHIPSYDFPRTDAPAYDEPRPHAPLQDKLHDYDIPSSDVIDTYDIPGPPRAVYDNRSHAFGALGTYDVPVQQGPRTAIITIDAPHSNRSSGVSAMSSSSSPYLSPSGSQSSLNTSLSLSSLCGSNRSSLEQQSHELYDIPPSEPRRVADSRLFSATGQTLPKNLPSSTVAPITGIQQANLSDPSRIDVGLFYDTPPVPRPAGIQAVEGVYDVPPQVTRDASPIPRSGSVDCLDGGKRFSSSSSDSRDSKENVAPIGGKELPLELDAAMEVLVKVHHEVQSAITKLFGFVSTTWRRRENMEKRADEIRTACHRIRNSVREFLEFAYGTLVNSTYAPDRTLSHKLAKLIKPLADSQAIVQSTTRSLDDKGWPMAQLVNDDENGTPDELDQLVACSRTLVEDVRQVSSFIQGNSTLLFKRSQLIHEKLTKPTETQGQKSPIQPSTDMLSKTGVMQDRPLPAPPVQHHVGIELDEEIPSRDFVNDYDYVNLESKEAVEREHQEIKASLPAELQKSFENVVKQSQIPVADGGAGILDANDRQLLRFYHSQMEAHIVYLTNAIDAFLLTIDQNHPPKVFVGHSKFVILGAHKLVYIGDTIHRNVSNEEVCNQTAQLCNKLCDSLKTLVANTKKAALQFPSVMAVQEMVDSVVDVSHVANDLKICVGQAAKM